MAFLPFLPPPPTTETFLTRGYFHDRVIPALSSAELVRAISDIEAYIALIVQSAEADSFRLKVPRTRPVQHSVPKRKHLRRLLAIPHPLPHSILSAQIAGNWQQIRAICAASTISLSVPKPSSSRAVESLFQRSDEPFVRARESVGARFLLKTDLVRFYPSIYTHSIPWAIHGKPTARRDPKNLLYGNRIDVCVRESQDKQTGGIPIGPDTSFIIGELIASRIDCELQQRLGGQTIRGTRFIDDYHLYFGTRGEAERAIAAIHGAARLFELEINDTKTELCEMPETFDPEWKSHLRGMQIEANDAGRSVHSLFDQATRFALQFPFDSVYTYVAKKLLDATVTIELWAVCEPMLLRAVLAEPSMMTVLVELLKLHGVVNQKGLTATLESICCYHAPLQQGYEVAWALWCACVTNTEMSRNVGDLIAQMDDDLVALVALDLNSRGLLDLPATPLWNSRMTADALNSEHWLLSYEGLEHGWLPSANGDDYIADDPFFSLLKNQAVSFYDPAGLGGTGYLGYGP
jgi:hypothetical protein